MRYLDKEIISKVLQLRSAHVKESGKIEALYFVHKDHLGLVLQLTNESGVVVETRGYDA
jgi:hypothetical protein